MIETGKRLFDSGKEWERLKGVGFKPVLTILGISAVIFTTGLLTRCGRKRHEPSTASPRVAEECLRYDTADLLLS